MNLLHISCFYVNEHGHISPAFTKGCMQMAPNYLSDPFTLQSGPVPFLSHSLKHLVTHLFSHSLTLSLIQSLTHSVTLSLIHSFSHLVTHTLIHSLTHSLAVALKVLSLSQALKTSRSCKVRLEAVSSKALNVFDPFFSIVCTVSSFRLFELCEKPYWECSVKLTRPVIYIKSYDDDQECAQKIKDVWRCILHCT